MKIFLKFFILVVLFANHTAAQVISDAAPKVAIYGANWRQQALTAPVIDREWRPKTGMPGEDRGVVSDTRVQKFVHFVYVANVENLSGRDIKGVAWEYNFADSNGRLLKSNVFFFPRPIRNGKRREVWATSQFAPTPTIDSAALEKDGGTYVESVGIRCIVFKGGDSWKRPDAPDADCDGLRKSIADFLSK